ncbi:hypothetical protein DFH07DRAFT_943517 [Mycena maculata]|uniref:DUF6534 domain-containing protein n=1 Tax=Mycena maculata TaxID=230809 RepID=A0AAD7IGR0_9AGAR|nr:hypothetical protein DFH07DRAFT_943517 [Mycena maculata]
MCPFQWSIVIYNIPIRFLLELPWDMSDSTSTIILSPASQVFIDTRTTSLGPWVLGGLMDSILMGIILFQVYNYFNFRRTEHGLSRYYMYLVIVVTFLSILKTSQAIAVVWVQNVLFFANPDIARTLLNIAWWQNSVTLMILETLEKLGRNDPNVWPSIIVGDAKGKVMWLLVELLGFKWSSFADIHTCQVHLVSVFAADSMITAGTSYTLRQRSTGLASTSSLINRLLRLVFESAIPPTLIATIDLILTQTLGSKLLWHVFVNYSLSKVYVISLIYTLNCISEYRQDHSQSRSHDGPHNRLTRHGDVELAPRNIEGNIFIQTQITTHVDRLKTGSDQTKSEDSPEKPRFTL